DRTVRLWDQVGNEWKERFPLKGHSNRVNAVAFSPDDKVLVSAGYDQTVRWWNLEAPQPYEPTVLQQTRTVHAVAFAPDGQRVAAADEERVRLWRSKVAAGWVPQGRAPSLDFSPNNEMLACAGGDYNTFVRLWDLPGTPKAWPDLKL